MLLLYQCRCCDANVFNGMVLLDYGDGAQFQVPVTRFRARSWQFLHIATPRHLMNNKASRSTKIRFFRNNILYYCILRWGVSYWCACCWGWCWCCCFCFSKIFWIFTDTKYVVWDSGWNRAKYLQRTFKCIDIPYNRVQFIHTDV